MKYGKVYFAGLTAEMQLDKAEYNRKKPFFATNIRVSDDTKKATFYFFA